LFGVINLSWLWSSVMIWLPISVFLSLASIFCFIGYFRELVENWKAKKNAANSKTEQPN
jgi:putative effector of murein hydrolase LrgA (UPF0299 family)